MLNKSLQMRTPWFGMGCKAQTAAMPEDIARICDAADRPKQRCARFEPAVSQGLC
jgi:hypothetical protein